jgi:hypothetical protein
MIVLHMCTPDLRMCHCQPYSGVRTLGLFWYQKEEPKFLIGLFTSIIVLRLSKHYYSFSTREAIVVPSLIEGGIQH